jgi:hypothetical protein
MISGEDSPVDPVEILSLCFEQMDEHQADFWLSEEVKQRVPNAEGTFAATDGVAEAIGKTALRLISEEPFSEEFVAARKIAQEFARINRLYSLRRKVLFELTAEELLPTAGNQAAIEALVEAKMAGRRWDLEEDASMDPDSWGRAPPEIQDLEDYLRDLRVMAVLTPDELRRVAGDREAFDALVFKIVPLGELAKNLSSGTRDEKPDWRRISDAKRHASYPLLKTGGAAEMVLRVVWDDLVIWLCEDIVPSMVGGARPRLWALSQLVTCTELATPTRQFLDLVGPCYIWGMDTACIILCRAVLDTAFREAVTDEVCQKYLGEARNEREGFGLAARIGAAFRERLIDPKIKQCAFNIKNRGDKAVHYEARAKVDTLGTIRDTLLVLQALVGNRR